MHQTFEAKQTIAEQTNFVKLSFNPAKLIKFRLEQTYSRRWNDEAILTLSRSLNPNGIIINF